MPSVRWLRHFTFPPRTSRTSTTPSPGACAFDDIRARRCTGGYVMDQPAWGSADRPNWSAIGDMIGELRRAMGGLNESQREMLKVTGSGWSPDRTIKAVVGPRGQLLELEIDPRVFRKPNSKA